MRQYLVTFHKTVPDDRGYDHRVAQRRVAVSANSEVAATYAAKAIFCQRSGIVDWRLRADSCEVVELRHLAA